MVWPNHLRNGSYGYSTDEEPVAAGSKRLKITDTVLRGDPRQPVLKAKKVRGSAWKPMPINKAIEGSVKRVTMIHAAAMILW